ncbi:MAG TPA: hypothetical protein VMM79_08570, partial [Longimicrobiales bacterium]|nr:hypothetical protein [Longimicrobiales bacterium]
MNGRAKRMAHGVIAGGIAGIVLLQLGRAGAAGESGQQPIPRVWDDEALAGFELPPPDADIEVHHIPSAYYYALDERVIHRTHPVYHPDFEPEGYLDSLRALGPGTQLDTDTLDTDEEWIRAGEVVFDSPQLFLPADQPGFGAAALAEEG